MKNKEFFMDQLMDIIVSRGICALKNGIPVDCTDSACDHCDLYPCGENYKDKLRKWLEEEQIAFEVDWTKVPVDTPIKVWDHMGQEKIIQHFSGYDEDGYIYVWCGGRTSHTTSDCQPWNYAELLEYNPAYLKQRGESND